MALKFNPITGKLDLVDSSQTTQSPNYTETFVSGDWVGPSSGFYTLSILGATHGKGINPLIQVYELNGGDYELVDVSTSVDSLNGDVTLGVVETPDERFDGKIIISENN